jgi:Phosphoribosylformylglycinamidine (FGAM) synthase, synthetase domain
MKKMNKPASVDINYEVKLQELIRRLINKRLLKSACDISEGGLFTALSESSILNPAGVLGFNVRLNINGLREDEVLFSEFEQAFVLSADKEAEQILIKEGGQYGIEILKIGTVEEGIMKFNGKINLNSGKIKSMYDSSLKELLNGGRG